MYPVGLGHTNLADKNKKHHKRSTLGMDRSVCGGGSSENEMGGVWGALWGDMLGIKDQSNWHTK